MAERFGKALGGTGPRVLMLVASLGYFWHHLLWQFTEGQWLKPQRAIRFPVRPDGVKLDFTLDAFSNPVVHARVVQVFDKLGIQEVQFLPVQVDGHVRPYFLLNALCILRCINDTRCKGQKESTSSVPGGGPCPSSSPRTSSRPWSSHPISSLKRMT